MLTDVTGNNLKVKCNNCEDVFNVNVKKELNFLEEFGEYENVRAECKKCGMIEVFNMNLPEDEDIDPEYLSELEIEQRDLVKKLSRQMERKGGKNDEQ